MPDRLANLLNEVIHVGVKARVKQNSGIDFALFGVKCGLIEQVGQIVQKRAKNPDRHLMHCGGHGHDSPFSRGACPLIGWI